LNEVIAPELDKINYFSGCSLAVSRAYFFLDGAALEVRLQPKTLEDGIGGNYGQH